MSSRADENRGTRQYVQKTDTMKYKAVGQEEKTMENTAELTDLQTKKFKEDHSSERKQRMIRRNVN